VIPPEPLWRIALAARMADAERERDRPERDRVVYMRKRFEKIRADPAALEEYRRKDRERKLKTTAAGKRKSRAKGIA
jgi:hypothetical protein